MQPLSRGRAAEDDRLAELRLREIVLTAAPSILPCDVQGSEKGQAARLLKTFRKFFQKKLSKKFGGYEKMPYLCKRFTVETGARKKDSSLKDFG